MHASRREFLGGTAAALALSPCAPAFAADDVLTPEAFGARGDGRTNDTDAFAAVSDAINARGGGTIDLRPVAYIVGRAGDRKNSAQSVFTDRFAFPPARILQFVSCAGSVIVRGNGATLRAAAGLRFGAFDPLTGRPLHHAMPFTRREFRGAPYIAMIYAQSCSGLIDISDIELDGNLGALDVGGPYGDNGWQVPGSGILLKQNSGAERLANIHAHHHPLDGLTITDVNERESASTIANVTCDYNGRQGCSLTGGRNYLFLSCAFRTTGKAGLHSPPGAGLDIEAGSPGVIRNLRFVDSEFSDNAGAGVVADSGDSADLSFDGCRFIGTRNWSAWPRKPGMRFFNCTFVGAIAHPYGDDDPARAAQFLGCSFLDDPALSPTGKVYLGRGPAKPIVNAPSAENVRFDTCRFRLTGEGALPFTRDVIYSDCIMSQRSPVRSHPGGTYLGIDSLSGNMDLSGAMIRGDVTLNGRAVPRTG